jgi:hypothetical protein
MRIQIREDPELLGQVGPGSVILFMDLDLVPDFMDLDLVPDLTLVEERICIIFALPVINKQKTININKHK